MCSPFVHSLSDLIGYFNNIFFKLFTNNSQFFFINKKWLEKKEEKWQWGACRCLTVFDLIVV